MWEEETRWCIAFCTSLLESSWHLFEHLYALNGGSISIFSRRKAGQSAARQLRFWGFPLISEPCVSSSLSSGTENVATATKCGARAWFLSHNFGEAEKCKLSSRSRLSVSLPPLPSRLSILTHSIPCSSEDTSSNLETRLQIWRHVFKLDDRPSVEIDWRHVVVRRTPRRQDAVVVVAVAAAVQVFVPPPQKVALLCSSAQ